MYEGLSKSIDRGQIKKMCGISTQTSQTCSEPISVGPKRRYLVYYIETRLEMKICSGCKKSDKSYHKILMEMCSTILHQSQNATLATVYRQSCKAYMHQIYEITTKVQL